MQSVLREALIVSTGPILLPEFLPLNEPLGSANDVLPSFDLPATSAGDWQQLATFVSDGLQQRMPDIYRQAIAKFDRLVISQAMERAGGLQSRAAELLGLSRPTLRAKLRMVSEPTPSTMKVVIGFSDHRENVKNHRGISDGLRTRAFFHLVIAFVNCFVSNSERGVFDRLMAVTAFENGLGNGPDRVNKAQCCSRSFTFRMESETMLPESNIP